MRPRLIRRPITPGQREFLRRWRGFGLRLCSVGCGLSRRLGPQTFFRGARGGKRAFNLVPRGSWGSHACGLLSPARSFTGSFTTLLVFSEGGFGFIEGRSFSIA